VAWPERVPWGQSHCHAFEELAINQRLRSVVNFLNVLTTLLVFAILNVKVRLARVVDFQLELERAIVRNLAEEV